VTQPGSRSRAGWGRRYPIYADHGVDQHLTGKTIDRPPIQTSTTFKKAPKAAGKQAEKKRLDFDKPDPDEPF
jgi:hypothetical protein